MTISAKAPRVKDIAAAMEGWAPSWTAESWDRVGLVAGDPGATVERAMVALELSEAALQAAKSSGASMLLTHHPPLFKPLADLRSDRPHTARLLQAAAGGLALFAAHTNLDAAPGGVNDALAERLGLTKLSVLAPGPAEGLCKLVTFAPAAELPAIAAALNAAGAGRVGAYRGCTFETAGTGSFITPEQGRPFIGLPGQSQRVEEVRLETWVPRAGAETVVRALLASHPYEEPAFDLYPLTQAPAGFGLGRLGRLTPPQPGAAFAAAAAAELDSPAAVVAGPLPDRLERVAVVGGSGGELLAAAAAAGAQMLVTGEARHHAAQEAEDLGLALLCLGHYATEEVIVRPWAERLGRMLADEGFICDVKPWTGSGPWRAVPGA